MPVEYRRRDFSKENWKQTIEKWGNVGRMITLLIYAVFIVATFIALPPTIPRWVDVLLKILAVTWFPILFLVVTPCRMWLEAQRDLKALEDSKFIPVFYSGRKNDKRPTLEKLFTMAHSLWVVTHAGTSIRGAQLMKHPLNRLIILDPHPSAQAIPVFAKAAIRDSATTIRGEVNNSLDHVRFRIEEIDRFKLPEVKTEVKVFDGPITSIIIGNPESKSLEGWAQVETYLPFSSVNDRPSVFFLEKDYPELFNTIISSFNQMWLAGTDPLNDGAIPNS